MVVGSEMVTPKSLEESSGLIIAEMPINISEIFDDNQSSKISKYVTEDMILHTLYSILSAEHISWCMSRDTDIEHYSCNSLCNLFLVLDRSFFCTSILLLSASHSI